MSNLIKIQQINEWLIENQLFAGCRLYLDIG